MNASNSLTQEQRDAVITLIGSAKPASDSLVIRIGESVRDVREHEHPKWEDLHCQNLQMWLGERMGPVLRRLLEAEARVAELETAQATVYRASHDSIQMGLYRTAAAARAHCEAEERRAWATFEPDWIEDEEDGVAELVVMTPDGEMETGYIVTALDTPSEYDEEADE